jgi:hypothetical protein
VPDRSYTVRLHFFDTRESNRQMVYTIEGKQVLDDFSVETEAGGLGKALVRAFEVLVSDGDGLQIVADAGDGVDVFESGIELIALDSEPDSPAVDDPVDPRSDAPQEDPTDDQPSPAANSSLDDASMGLGGGCILGGQHLPPGPGEATGLMLVCGLLAAAAHRRRKRRR